MNPTFIRRKLRLAMISALAIGSAGVAFNGFAATDTDNLGVSASVTATCTIVTAPVLFGTYDPTSGTDLAAEGSVTVLCTNGTAGNITLGQGTAAVGDVPGAPVRQMSGGAAGAGRLGYFLYSDEALTTAWGNTAPTGVAHAGNGISTEITVYGEVPAGQNIIAGSGGTAYADTVVATVTF